MEKYTSITRKGILNFKGEDRSNQCTEKGNNLYFYQVKILFEKGIELDNDGFVIDHHKIDDVVQKVSLSSCELMSNNILNNIEFVLRERSLDFIGIKLKIEPLLSIDKTGAHFQEFRCKKDKMLSMVVSM